MGIPSSSSAKRVQEVLQNLGLSLQVVELPQSTRSAREAAETIGCLVEQIAKSLVFRSLESGKPILVIASGRNRVDLNKLARLVGEPVAKPDADYVRRRTGFVIGGIPPVGHLEPLETYIDEHLLQLSEIWAAAGTPHAVFQLKPSDLISMTGGKVVSISQDCYEFDLK